MSSFLFVALLLAAAGQVSGSGLSYTSIDAASGADETAAVPSTAVQSEKDAIESIDPRTPVLWRKEIRAALRCESSSQGSEREAAVRQLVKLYRGLGGPTKLVDTEQRQLRAQLRSRLQRTSETLATQARRQSTLKKSAAATTNQAMAGGKSRADAKDHKIARIDVSVEVLAQQIGQAPPMQILPLTGANLIGPDQSSALAELIRTTIAPDRWDPNVGGAVLAQQIGAPGQGAAFGGGQRGVAQAGQRQNADAGLELVELIQQTIAPDSWDIHGGPGTIMYFSPLRVLVVRQTDEVHGALGGLVNGLRN